MNKEQMEKELKLINQGSKTSVVMIVIGFVAAIGAIMFSNPLLGAGVGGACLLVAGFIGVAAMKDERQRIEQKLAELKVRERYEAKMAEDARGKK